MTRKLRLTSFERCMFYDDREDYPNHGFVRARFTGIVNRTHFNDAVRSILQNHPLFKANILVERREYWIFSDDIAPRVVYITEEPTDKFPAVKHIDLTQDSGLVIFIVQGAKNFDLTLQFHHACSDGAGLRQFILDLLHAYRQHTDQTNQVICKTRARASRLYNRQQQRMGESQQLKGVKSHLMEAVSIFNYMIRKARPLSRQQSIDSTGYIQADFPSSLHCQLSREDKLSLKTQAKTLNVSLNDLLLSHFFQTLWNWQKAIGIYSPRDWVRIAVPFDIRDRTHRSLPAVNQVGLLFIDRRAIDAGSPEELLRGISNEIRHIQRHRVQFTFLKILSYLDKIPGALKYLVKREDCRSSVVFSNMGKVFYGPLAGENGKVQIDGLTLTEIQALAPVRIYNSISIFFIEYAGTLSINLQFDNRVHTHTEAASLLELYTQSLLTDT